MSDNDDSVDTTAETQIRPATDDSVLSRVFPTVTGYLENRAERKDWQWLESQIEQFEPAGTNTSIVSIAFFGFALLISHVPGHEDLRDLVIILAACSIFTLVFNLFARMLEDSKTKLRMLKIGFFLSIIPPAVPAIMFYVMLLLAGWNH